jgi:hypothetical protein
VLLDTSVGARYPQAHWHAPQGQDRWLEEDELITPPIGVNEGQVLSLDAACRSEMRHSSPRQKTREFLGASHHVGGWGINGEERTAQYEVGALASNSACRRLHHVGKHR